MQEEKTVTEAARAADEATRLDALSEYGIDAPLADPGLDRVVQLAASIFQVPIALVSLVEEARQLFAARLGIDVCETDRGSSFCAHALGMRAIMEVPDATLDPRFAANRLVTGPPFIRFYAGCPLVSPSGHVLGTLCLIDVKPRRSLTVEEQSNLHDLAAIVMDKLELRRLDLALRASPMRFENMAEVSPDAIVCMDDRARITFWNPSAERLFGYRREDMMHASVATLAPDATVANLLAIAADDTSLSMGRTVELDIRCASGVLMPVEISTSMWREARVARFCAVLRDVTERRRNEERLYRLAHVDALTDLPNRLLFRERVEAALAASADVCVMMIDLDGFKDVNDGYGHAAGDTMLAATARRLRAAVPAEATVARMGGDEFALVLPDESSPTHIGQVANAIIDAVSEAVVLEGEPVTIGASVGIARFPADGASFRELLSSADLALYEAKAHGKQCHRFYSRLLREAAMAKQAYQTELSRALSEREWVLFYEPIVRLDDGLLAGVDAKLRWRHPGHGLIGPAAFAPALQVSPVAARIGHWMLATACAQLVVWRRVCPDLRMSLAVLDAQFRAGDLADRVRVCLTENQLPGAALELEITETILLRQDAQSVATLAALHQMGVSIALADYGTGQASFELLKRAPLARLKIDPAFVRGMSESRADAAIIRVILYLGRRLSLAVTAKGVSTQAQYDRLMMKGCREAQGPRFGEPMSAEEMEARVLLAASIGRA